MVDLPGCLFFQSPLVSVQRSVILWRFSFICLHLQNRTRQVLLRRMYGQLEGHTLFCRLFVQPHRSKKTLLLFFYKQCLIETLLFSIHQHLFTKKLFSFTCCSVELYSKGFIVYTLYLVCVMTRIANICSTFVKNSIEIQIWCQF